MTCCAGTIFDAHIFHLNDKWSFFHRCEWFTGLNQFPFCTGFFYSEEHLLPWASEDFSSIHEGDVSNPLWDGILSSEADDHTGRSDRVKAMENL